MAATILQLTTQPDRFCVKLQLLILKYRGTLFLHFLTGPILFQMPVHHSYNGAVTHTRGKRIQTKVSQINR